MRRQGHKDAALYRMLSVDVLRELSLENPPPDTHSYGRRLQSKECQKAQWRDGHKQVCKMFSVHKERAASISGNPNAWSHLATFIEYHHATLVNCTLACYLRAMPEIPTVATSHFLLISLLYRNDPTRRPQDQFEVRGMHLEDRNDPAQPPTFKILMTDRAAAVEMGKKEFGNDYWGTGAYVLMVKFAPSPLAGALPFWKHFGIDKEHARATPARTHPWDQLRENVHEGKRQKFCCGRVEGLPTCCCGGWTHEQVCNAFTAAEVGLV